MDRYRQLGMEYRFHDDAGDPARPSPRKPARDPATSWDGASRTPVPNVAAVPEEPGEEKDSPDSG